MWCGRSVAGPVLGVCWLIATTLHLHAEAPKSTSGWSISEPNMGNQFRTCSASKRVKPAITIMLTMTVVDGRLEVLLRKATSFGTRGHKDRAELWIEDRAIYSGLIALVSHDHGEFQPPLTSKEIASLARTTMVELRADGGSATYDVSGIAHALGELRRCRSRALEAARQYGPLIDYSACKHHPARSPAAWDCMRQIGRAANRVKGRKDCLDLADEKHSVRCSEHELDVRALSACPDAVSQRDFADCKEKYRAYTFNALTRELDQDIAQRRQEALATKQAVIDRRNKAIASLPAWEGVPSPIMEFVDKGDQELPATSVFRSVAPSIYGVQAADSENDWTKGSYVTGSAVAVSTSLALTNCHVIKGQSFLRLIPSQGSTDTAPIPATPFKADLQADRCLLSVSGGLWPLRTARTAKSVEIGERVYAVGNPKGLSNTLTEGLVSGLRQMHGITLLQTSAPVSTGSSGGALIDAQGNLIGITTFILRDAQNLNFAIAADEFFK